MPNPSAFKKTVVDRPTRTPAQDARNNHFRMLMNSTELSTTFRRMFTFLAINRIDRDAACLCLLLLHARLPASRDNGTMIFHELPVHVEQHDVPHVNQDDRDGIPSHWQRLFLRTIGQADDRNGRHGDRRYHESIGPDRSVQYFLTRSAAGCRSLRRAHGHNGPWC